MTGSFLFVKPSNSKGEPGTAYSDKSPQYQYDHASWEWLLERALRRTLLPWALTKSHSRVILYGHEDQYSMHRWGSYGKSYDAGSTPSDYTGIGGPESSSRKTDADLSVNDRETLLPGSWIDRTEVPSYSTTKVTYGIADLEEMVASLPFSLEWLPPDWSSESLKAWDLTARTTEKTKGTAKPSPDPLVWTWKTTVEHIPYEIPYEIPFKCLSHMRTDDDTVKVNITNDDNKSIEVETAPTPASAPRTPDGSIRSFHDTQIRVADLGAAYEAGQMISKFSIPYRHGLDYSESTGPVPYARDGKTSESISTIGCLIEIPDERTGNIAVSYGGDKAWFIPEVDWGGKPTWWHANDFPKGLDSVLSPKLKAQLKALCPECQPAIPPGIPAFEEKFPDVGRLPWNHWPGLRPASLLDWMRHLSLACTPFDMSARLDAMTTTVHLVPAIFAKIKTVKTELADYTSNSTNSDGSKGQSWYSNSKKITVEGTSTNPIPAGDGVESVSGIASKDSDIFQSFSGPEGSYITRSTSRRTWEDSFESNSEFLVCLRSTGNTTLSTKTTTKTTSKADGDLYDEPIYSETESSEGKLPESYDPDPDDLLFPDWVLPWIETAELFASIESRLECDDGYDITTSDYSYYPADGESTFSHSGSGSGSRTHKAQRKIISLGQMTPDTGRFPALDTALILSDADPDPSELTVFLSTNFTAVTTKTTDSNGDTKENKTTTHKAGVQRYRSRSVSYYVVVKWKFDRTDPKTLETDSPLADLYRKLVDAKKALYDKKRELEAAQAALEAAQADLRFAEAALKRAKEQLADPEGAEAELLEKAQAALDQANQELSNAKLEKSTAKLDHSTAEDNTRAAERDLQSAQAAYDAAVETGEGVEEARNVLENAYTEYFEAVGKYNEASVKLADAEDAEKVAQAAADAAQEYYDTLHEKIEEILQKAVDDAQAAVDEATSRADKWTQEIEKIEGEIPGLEADVEAALQAIREAVGDV